MTNKDRWNLITAGLPSPQSYIDFGFYYLISLGLQRRVWFYSGHNALYLNQYIVFVGPPAIGKGLVLSKIAYFARFHKDNKHPVIKTSTGPELAPLFPLGADSITFEELICEVASSRRNVLTGDQVNPNYAHCSYAFILPELSSLFKRKTEDVSKFLLNAYDCDQYDYKTKHQGKECIRKLCLNFIAATQMDFLKDAHRTGLFGQGFASRTLFLFESRRRFDKFHIATNSTDTATHEAEKELLAWLKKLSQLYGQLTYDKETARWIEKWYIETHCPHELKASTRMQDYLGRKKVIILKLAAALHFADSLELELPLETVQLAITMLDAVEPRIEAGLALSGRNELHIGARKMLSLISAKRDVEERELILTFGADFTIEEIFKCIKELELGYGLLKYEAKDGKIHYKV
jgi:hypothetical protein